MIIDIKVLLEADSRIPVIDQVLYHNSVEVGNYKRLCEIGITSDDVFELDRRIVPAIPSLEHVHPQILSNPDAFHSLLHQNPHLMNELRLVNPQLADAASDPTALRLQALMNQAAQARVAEIQRLNELQANPLDPEAQRQIEERIQVSNIEQNMQNAFEYNPESFARVAMLYIPVRINGTALSAFVDSGAQRTIMSFDCVKMVGIDRLIDKRFAGIAKGVGTSEIIGRIHMVQLQIGSQFFPCSLDVLKDQSIDLLFGLDMQRKYQIIIDLKGNCLRIGEECISFLSEKDLPMSEDTGMDIEEKENPTQLEHTPLPPVQAPQQQVAVPPPVQRNPQLETNIKVLMDSMGVSRQQAEQALLQCNGNVEYAASMLFSI